MLKVTASFLLFLFLFIFSTNKALAVSITISNYPSSIGANPFSLDVSVLGANPGTNYLRIDLFKDGTPNYFGETLNNTNWISSSNGSDYFPITINDSSATVSATLQGRIGSPSTTDYPGPGAYKLKIRRYTSSSYTFSDPVDVNITLSTPTPTPTPTIEPTVAPTQTNTPSPTPTRTPTPVPTKTPTPKPTATQDSNSISSIASNLEINGTPEGIVLGINETSSNDPSPTPIASPLVLSERKQPVLGYALIGLGILLLFGSIVVLLKQSKSRYNETLSDETNNKTEPL